MHHNNIDLNKIEQFSLLMRRESDIGENGVLDSDAVRYHKEIEENKNYRDIRPPFFRDVDRIVHSKAYARYIDKTQVFFEINNANVTHRSLHVILVSRISRQIGRVLKLNLDLIEAIALGHDIGHAPYGHIGEELLNEISEKYNLGLFHHNAQSVRWLSHLERRFPDKPAQGLNLTLQVLDGILCHDGEINEQQLKPKVKNGKNWQDHFKEYEDCFTKNSIKRIPMSYEGIAMRFADTISYIGRDIEDAILLKIIKRSEIPEECVKVLGDTNRKIMNNLIMDVLDFSLDNDTIGYSEDVFEALKLLKVFNYEKIYTRRDTMGTDNSQIDKDYIKNLNTSFNLIFKTSLTHLEEQNFEAPIFKDHIEYVDDPEYNSYYNALKQEGKLPLIVRDYVAGMSDKYFREIYERFKK